MTDHDLVVADATLRGREGRWRIGIDGDRIAAVTRDAIGGREEVDAGGALVTESFVNGHLHLDKVHTLDRIGDAALTAYTAGDMASALTSIELASAVKAGYDRPGSSPTLAARCSRPSGTASGTCWPSPTSTPRRGSRA